MADNNGWIKLHRKLLDNPIVMKDADHLAVWMYLLLNATHAEYPALFKGKKIMLQPGQLITGCISIGNQLSIAESKVRRTLNDFISDGQIDRQTSNKNSLITVLNWDSYQNSDGQATGTFGEKHALPWESQSKSDRQSDGQKKSGKAYKMGSCADSACEGDGQNDIQVTDNRQTSDGQVTTNKNVKKVKKVKECKEIIYSDVPELNKAIIDFIDYRKGIKKPMTENAVSLLISKLNKLSGSIPEQIEILNQSIVNGWQGIFPLKKATTGRTEPVPSWIKKNSFNDIPQHNYGDMDAFEKQLLGNGDP